MTKRIVITFGAALFAALLCLTPCRAHDRRASHVPLPEVKNVIFMIGDGMGTAHVSALMLERGYEPVNLQRADAVALTTTYSANNRVTDSAAAGTALATGSKTGNHFLGQSMEGERYVTTLEKARDEGMPTGIVVTSYATHATPAAFYAHIEERSKYQQIALQLLDADIDVLFAGGRRDFVGREDGRDLLAELRGKGYTVIDTLPALATAEGERVIGLFAEGHMPGMHEGRGDFLPLALERALAILTRLGSERDEGFFLMVEGSQIDFAAHDNDPQRIVAEMADFDRAVGVAFDYADAHPGTLVVVCADHETGGLSLPSGKSDFTLADSGVEYKFGTGSHTGSLTPVFLYGTGAHSFGAVIDNTDLPRQVQRLLGLE